MSSIYSSLKNIRSLLGRQDKIKWVTILCLSLVSSVLELLTASSVIIFAQVLIKPEMGGYYLKKIDILGDVNPQYIVLVFSLIFLAIYFFKSLFSILEIFIQSFFLKRMNYNFKQKLLRHFTRLDYNFYLTRNSSYGIAVMGDSDTLFAPGLSSLASILTESMVLVGILVPLIFVDPKLALIITFGGAVIGLLVMKILFPLFYRWGYQVQAASLRATQSLFQFFQGFKEIILFGRENYFIDEYKKSSLETLHIKALTTATHVLPRIILEMLFVLLFAISVFYMCLQQEPPQEMLGILAGYLYAGFRIIPSTNRIISLLNTYKVAIPGIERLHHEYHEIQDRRDYAHIPEFTFSKHITLQDISFRYYNIQNQALSGINLTIKKGEIIGIVGQTGSGKSTLVDVILGLLPPFKGKIVVDDQFPVRCVQWHQKVGYVPQSIYLIDDTIEANIAFGESREGIDKRCLEKAIDDAQLRELIDQLPEGTQTIVGERGVRLSGGERQRIAIARALYRNPEVLIFDEATSALDHETESKLMETIHKVSHDRTVIMIAHRLTTLKNCDRIIALEKGEIKESSLEIKQLVLSP